MLFPTLEYAVFFVFAFAGAWALSRRLVAHKVFLLSASWAFYAFWDWRFLPVLLGLSFEASLIAKALEHPSSERSRRFILGTGVAAVLATLAFFKYITFATSALIAGLEPLGVALSPPRLPEVALPVGISFFTFHAISLMVDAWKRRIPVPVHLLDALLYVAFFPQLVAGPILRAASFLPTLSQCRDRAHIDAARALQRIGLGLFKKTVLAQVLASTIVDSVFEAPAEHTSLEVLIGIYGYAAQIFCDFSGYTDMAIGSAALLGYAMPDNFNAPYAAHSPQDFWRRWHISLSSWLRDYLFIPLGGSRGSFAATALALALTMILAGLWHGAGWTFVAWGAFHAVGLIAHRAWVRWPRAHALRGSWGWRALAPILTFHFVCAGWVFFRASSLGLAAEVFATLGRGMGGLHSFSVVSVVALGLFVGMMSTQVLAPLSRWLSRVPLVAQGITFAVFVIAVDAFGPRGIAPFIYFQF